MKATVRIRPIFLAAISVFVFAGCSYLVDKEGPTIMQPETRTFQVDKVLDGQWSGGPITVTCDPLETGIRVTAVDRYDAPETPLGAGAIQMILAFQLAPGKTRDDFKKFKKLDFPWVTSNHGSNRATIWTKRTTDWPFDAFEDVTFASKRDFERAYAGNPELAKAGEGLFGDKVLAAVVEENR